MSSRTGRTATRWVSAVAAVVAVCWLTTRVVFTATGVPGWLFWPLLAAEAFALVRLVLWSLRLAASPAGAVDERATQVEDATEIAGSGMGTRAVVVLDTDANLAGLEMTLISATRVESADVVYLVGPHNDAADALADRYGAVTVDTSTPSFDPAGESDRRADRLGVQALRAIADGAILADTAAFVTSGSIAHHHVFELAEGDLADPDVAYVQSMSRSGLERDAAAVVHNMVTAATDGAQGIAEWNVDASVLRTQPWVQLLATQDVPVATTHQLRAEMLAAGWLGRWSETSLSVANRPESSRRLDSIVTTVARLRGAISPKGPLLGRGVGARARLAALSSVLDDLVGAVALVVIVVLCGALLSGRAPIDIDARIALAAGVVVHALAGSWRWSLSGRRLGSLAASRTALGAMDVSVASLLYTVISPRSASTRMLRRAIPVAMTATIALFASLALRSITGLAQGPLPAASRSVELVVMFSGVVAAVPLLRAMDVIVPSRRRRLSSRATSSISALVDGAPAEIVDLSPLGLGVRRDDGAEIGASIQTELDIPGRADPLVVHGVVRSAVPLEDGGVRVGVDFGTASAAERAALMDFWASSWIPEAAAPTVDFHSPPLREEVRVRVNQRSSRVLRLVAAVTLIATGVAGLPPYGVASAAEVPLPTNTLAVTKQMGSADGGSQARALLGEEIEVELTAHNTWSADSADAERYFNVSFRDIVPADARIVPDSFSITPTSIIADQPEKGQTTLVWTNVSDAQPGSSTSLTYRLAQGANDSTLPLIGDTIGSTATAYGSTDPRRVTAFDTSGALVTPDASKAKVADAAALVTIVPIRITKQQLNPESEMVRGAHLPQTYSLEVTNNRATGTESIVVDDYLPAALEFLGCGTVDHTADGAVEYPDAMRLDDSTADLSAGQGCTQPTLVETVEVDPDGVGPRSKGVYTHVQWSIGSLEPAGVRTIRYQAAIPERANVVWPTSALDDAGTGVDDTPVEVPVEVPAMTCPGGPDSCAQIANLDNNAGPWSTETGREASLTNVASVDATTTATRREGVPARQQWDQSSTTVSAEDLAVSKSACNDAANGTGGGSCSNGVIAGNQTLWSLVIRTSEYRQSNEVSVEDLLGDGLDYIKGSATVSTKDVGQVEPSIESLDDGRTQLGWSLSHIDPASEVVISYRTATAEGYRATGRPILAFDTLDNSVRISGTTSVVRGSDTTGEQSVADLSSASLASTWSSVDKRTLTGKEAASVAVDGQTCDDGRGASLDGTIAGGTFAPGDLVCFDLLVDFPTGVRMRNATVADFLPPYASYVGYTEMADSAKGQLGPAQIEADFDNGVIWDFGEKGDGGDRYTPLSGARFHVVVAARVINEPQVDTSVDLYSNLLKVAGVDTAGATRVSPRDDDTYLVAHPVLDLTKGVVDVQRDDRSIDSYPRPTAEAGNDSHTVRADDLATFRLVVPNSGLQFLPSGEQDHPAVVPPAQTPEGFEEVQVSDAFNVELLDRLPAGVGCDDAADVPLTPTARLVLRDGALALRSAPTPKLLESKCDTDTDTARFVVDRIPAGYDLELSYTMRVPGDIGSGSIHRNEAGVRVYDDRVGALDARALRYFPADNIDPAIAPDGKVTPNAPAAADDASLVTSAVASTKVSTTSIDERSNNSANQATIGERIDYTATITVPSGTTAYSLTASDKLPNGLSYLAGSARLQVPDGIASKRYELADRKDGKGWSLRFPDTVTAEPDTALSFIVTYTATVDDVAGNKQGTRRTNTVRTDWFSATPHKGADPDRKATSKATVKIVEPSPTIAKSHTPDGALQGGDVATYTLSVGNASGRSPLHDVTVVDCVPAGLTEVTPLGDRANAATVTVLTDASAPCPSGSTRIDWDLAALEDVAVHQRGPGLQAKEIVSLSYSARLIEPAAGDATLVNTAEVHGSSISTSTKGERTTYLAKASDSLTTAAPTITKTVDPAALLPGDDTAYTLNVSIPAGLVLHDATLIDAMPADVIFSGYGSLSGLDAAPCAGSLEESHTLEPDGKRIGWYLGDVVTGDEPCTFTLGYSAYVGSAAARGDELVNTADLHWNLTDRADDVESLDGTGFDKQRTATAEVTVVEPELTISKSVDDVDGLVEGGQELRYTVTVANTGDHSAYDIDVTDEYPAGLGEPYGLEGTCVGAADATSDVEQRRLAWALFDGATGLDPSGSCTLTYRQRVAPATASALSDGAELSNTAAITGYWGDPEHTADDREDLGYKHYRGATTDAEVTVVLPKLSIVKTTADGSEVQAADVGTPFGWQLMVRNDGRGTAFGIDIADQLPQNWTFDTDSVGITTSNGSHCAPGAGQLDPVIVGATVDEPREHITWTDLCDLGPRSWVRITFNATPGPDAVTNPGLIDSRGDKVLHANDVTVAGSDAGGNPLPEDSDDAAATLRSADLRLRKTDASADGDGAADSAGFAVGRPGNYYLDVSNLGADAATGPIVVTDTLPVGLTAADATGDGWTCETSDAGRTVSCTTEGPLAAKATLPRLTVTVDVGLDALGTGKDTGTVTNTATVTAATPDPDPLNNTDDEPTPVARVSDMSISKQLDQATPFVPGTAVRYPLSVTNLGPSPAAGSVDVVDDLPDGLRLVSVVGTGWDCSASDIPAGTPTGPSSFSGTAPNDRNGKASCVRTETGLASGASLPDVVVTALIDPALPAGTDVRNVATVSHPNDPNPENDSSSNDGSADPKATLTIVKDDAGATFAAGQNDARYYVTASNSGPSVETGAVVVRDSIAEDLQLGSVSGTGWDCKAEIGTGFADGERGSFACTWTNGTDAPVAVGVGETLPLITVVVRVAPDAARDPRPDAENTVQNRATVTGVTETEQRSSEVETPVAAVADLRIDKSHSGDSEPWVVGNTEQFVLSVSNAGPSSEYGRVVVTDVLPEGLEFAGASGDGWDCELRNGPGTGPNGTVRCVADRDGLDDDAALLAAGEELAPITVSVTVLASAAPIAQADPEVFTNWVVNRATVVGITDTTDASDEDRVPVQPLADLTIVKSHEGDTFQVGGTGVVTLEVINNGPNVAAAPVTVTDELPVGLTYESATGDDWSCTADDTGRDVTCTYAPTLGVDESSTVELTVEVGPQAYDPDGSHEIRNVATVDGPTKDPKSDNDSDDDIITVDPLVDLEIDKSHTGDFSVGADGTFDLVVTNNGPNPLPAGAVTVTDSLPDGLDFRSATGDGWTCDVEDSTATVICTIDRALAIDEALPTISIVVAVTPAAEGGVVNTAEVSTPVVDAEPSNDTDDDDVTIVPMANLSITKSVLGELTTGSAGLWQIIVSNDGPSAAQNPVVVDRLPAGVSDITASGDGFDCQVDDNEVVCTRTSPLAADDSASIVVNGLVDAEGGTTIANTATVSTPTAESDDSDNSATASAAVVDVAGATQTRGSSSDQQSLPARLAFTGLTVLGFLLAAGSMLLGGFLLTGFGRRRRSES